MAKAHTIVHARVRLMTHMDITAKQCITLTVIVRPPVCVEVIPTPRATANVIVRQCLYLCMQ